jgi:hypothetical protein
MSAALKALEILMEDDDLYKEIVTRVASNILENRSFLASVADEMDMEKLQERLVRLEKLLFAFLEVIAPECEQCGHPMSVVTSGTLLGKQLWVCTSSSCVMRGTTYPAVGRVVIAGAPPNLSSGVPASHSGRAPRGSTSQ